MGLTDEDVAATGAFNEFVVPGSSKMEGELVGNVVCDRPLFEELLPLTGNPIKSELLGDAASGNDGVSEFRLPIGPESGLGIIKEPL